MSNPASPSKSFSRKTRDEKKNAKAGDFPERVYGSDAIALAARFPGDVYPNLKALLGLPAQNTKVLEYSARHPALKIEAQPIKGTVALRSGAFGADEEPFMVEEIIAMELQSIQKNAEAMAGKGSTVKDIVITVPPYLSAEEKRAIEFAADLAGLRVLSLTSDGLAVGLNYATTRTFPSVTEGGKAELHLVFDMGAGSTKATVLKFQGRTVKDVGKFNKTIQEVQVLGTGWDRTLGGDALNAVIVDDMMENFVSSKAAKAAAVSIESVQAHGRAAAKLWKEAERIRQVLSANTESQASFEGLYEDIDFRYKLNRATFEKLAEAHAARIWPAIESALLKADIEIGELDSIILHGGAVRTPFVQKQLETIFGKADKIRSNVNPDEAAVFGAGFKGAELSPSFRVKEIKTYDVAGYAVGMKWTNVYGKGQHQQLFNPESLTGKVKTVSFQNQQDFRVTFYQHVGSSENVSPGSAEKEIMRVSMTNVTASVAQIKEKHTCTDGDILVKLSVRLNPDDSEAQITKAVLHCETEEEEKKDSMVDSVKGLFGFGSKKDEQEVLDDSEQIQASGSEITSSSSSSSFDQASPAASASPSPKDGKSNSKRLIEIPLTFETERLGYPQLETKDILRIKERLVAFDESDRSRRLREESLNQLEGFTYRVRDIISDDSFIEVSTQAERSSLEEKAKTASEWLYGEGADASREELKSKLKEMKDILRPIEDRKEQASQRPAKIQSMKDSLDSTMAFIDSMKSQIKAAEEMSSSIASESSSTTTAEPSSSTSNDFEGLEDEETTSSTTTTTSSQAPFSTPAMPQYTKEDLDEVVAIYETVNAWFVAKLAEQEALPPTADPILLVEEIHAKSQELTTASMNVIMKAMKIPERERAQWGDYGSGGGSSSSSKKSKTKTTSSKSKKAKATKSKSSKGPKMTEIDLGDGKKKTMFEMNADMTEEEIAAALEAQFGAGDFSAETGGKEAENGKAAEEEKEHKIDEL